MFTFLFKKAKVNKLLNRQPLLNALPSQPNSLNLLEVSCLELPIGSQTGPDHLVIELVILQRCEFLQDRDHVTPLVSI